MIAPTYPRLCKHVLFLLRIQNQNTLRVGFHAMCLLVQVLAVRKQLSEAQKVAAVIDGRFAVSLRDVKAVAVPALQHRIVRTFEAQTANRLPIDVIEELISENSYT